MVVPSAGGASDPILIDVWSIKVGDEDLGIAIEG